MEKYKFLEHTADIKFQAFGKTLEEAFANSAFAMREIMLKDIDKTKIKKKIKKAIKVTGKDYESLLYNFLEEFLFLLDSESFILSEIDSIKIKKLELTANISGDNSKNYNLSNDVKAVTYNQMFVKQISSGWQIQVVLDV